MLSRLLTITLLCTLVAFPATATEKSGYQPARVVYDVSSQDPQVLQGILDRVSLLQKIYGNDPFESSIIIVVHEGSIPLFVKGRQTQLMQRASSLSLGDIIQFRICSASASMQGFSGKDFHDFIRMVPMADAEIVRLQHDGYAYLH